MICDSTPDVSQTEQNILLVRYVHQDKDSGVWETTERSIQFKDFHKKTYRDISEIPQAASQDSGIPLENCRRQGYDNGANMSGNVKGVKMVLHKTH